MPPCPTSQYIAAKGPKQESVSSVSKTVQDNVNSVSNSASSKNNIHSSGGFSSDAKQMAKDAEKMKDNAMRDLDKRIGKIWEAVVRSISFVDLVNSMRLYRQRLALALLDKLCTL